jgi:hypothetical protein
MLWLLLFLIFSAALVCIVLLVVTTTRTIPTARTVSSSVRAVRLALVRMVSTGNSAFLDTLALILTVPDTLLFSQTIRQRKCADPTDPIIVINNLSEIIDTRSKNEAHLRQFLDYSAAFFLTQAAKPALQLIHHCVLNL